MRHRVAKKKLSRTKDHRKALLRNLSRSLILNDGIETTLAKAKFVKPYVEKLVTKAKKNSDAYNVNLVGARLNSKEATKVLFSDLVTKYADRAGGYTRIVKLGFRAGDKAPMARLEWVEDVKAESEKETKSPRSKKAEKKKVETATVEENTEDIKEAVEENTEEVSKEE